MALRPPDDFAPPQREHKEFREVSNLRIAGVRIAALRTDSTLLSRLGGARLRAKAFAVAVTLTSFLLGASSAFADGGNSIATATPITGVAPMAAFAAHPVARASAGCPNVVFIGAAGSGELAGSRSPGTYRWLGPEVNKMATVMQDALAGSGLTMSTSPVKYPADSTDELFPSKPEIAGLLLGPGPQAAALLTYKRNHVGKYLASIDQGVRKAISDATDTVSACPLARLVLAGYSQGAMVIHQAELKLARTGDTAVLGHIAGTLQLGDGDRVSHTQATEFGTSQSSGEGIRTYFHGTSPHDVFSPSNTANICNSHDIVCDFTPKRILHYHQSTAVHTSYATVDGPGPNRYSPLLTQAAKWLANKMTAQPDRVVFSGAPGTGAPPATLGPYSMTPFGPDPQDTGTVSGVSDPAGSIAFAASLDHEFVGEGWETWSNGYTGDVYMSDDSDTATVQLPSGTHAFYLYAEPNVFADFDVNATTADGTTSGPVTVYGNSGATYFGFYATGRLTLSSITVNADDKVAIGEFGISR